MSSPPAARATAVQPAERRLAEAWLEDRGLAWPPGATFAARGHGDAIVAMARLAEPPPGDGHHREHVRELLLAGSVAAEDALPRAARAAAGAWAGRLEARLPATARAEKAALLAAGLEREALLPRGWREPSGQFVDRELWGRPLPEAAGAPAPCWPAQPPAPRGEPGSSGGKAAVPLELRWHDGSTREALAAFLATLAPGRAYPPGTLLSEAERLETSRRGALEAAWVLALSDGQVVGGVVLEAEPEPERAHVRRVHLDVAPSWRGRGVARRLLAAAAAGARERLGALELEADPRAGNEGACGALAAAGFALAGVQRGAWRLRFPAGRADEDVLILRRSTP